MESHGLNNRKYASVIALGDSSARNNQSFLQGGDNFSDNASLQFQYKRRLQNSSL